MALKDFQFRIQPNTLYEIQVIPTSINEVINYSMEVLGGSVDIYGTYNDTPPPTPPTGMSLYITGFTGIDDFGNIPRYIFLSGSATDIILNGIKPVEVIL